MNIDNIEKAVELNKTRKGLIAALKQIERMESSIAGGSSMVITHYSDGSGDFNLPTVYASGNHYNELYEDLCANIGEVYRNHLEIIEQKIKDL